jgi:hypothetical protein
MNVVRRLFALFWISSAIGALAALVVRRRVVPVDDPEANEVRLTAILGPMMFESTAPAFRGGRLDCWYGGGVVDLRKATLDPAGATLRVRAIFGGGQIIVPADWRVETSVVGLGGIGDARDQVEPAVDAPTLTVEGVALFGGFGIQSELSAEEAEKLRQAVEESKRWPIAFRRAAQPSA